MHRHCLVLAAIALAGTFTSCASLGRWPSDLPFQGFDAANAEIGGVVVGETKIAEVLARLGATPIGARPEGGTRTLCYRAPQHVDATVLVLEAAPAGESDAITGFRLLRSPALAAHARCVASAVVGARLATGGGLRLGLERDAVDAALGRPVAEDDGTLLYRSVAPGDVPELYDGVDVSFSDAGVVSGVVVFRDLPAD